MCCLDRQLLFFFLSTNFPFSLNSSPWRDWYPHSGPELAASSYFPCLSLGVTLLLATCKQVHLSCLLLGSPVPCMSLPSRLRAGWCFPFMSLCRFPPLPMTSHHFYRNWQPQTLVWAPHLCSQAPVWHFHFCVVFNLVSLWVHPLSSWTTPFMLLLDFPSPCFPFHPVYHLI